MTSIASLARRYVETKARYEAGPRISAHITDPRSIDFLRREHEQDARPAFDEALSDLRHALYAIAPAVYSGTLGVFRLDSIGGVIHDEAYDDTAADHALAESWDNRNADSLAEVAR